MPLTIDDETQARTRLVSRRDRVERLLELAKALPKADRALVEQVLRRGATAAEIARLGRKRPRFVQRRLRRLLRRMHDPLFAFVASNPELVPYRHRDCVNRVVIHGLSLRRVARRTGKTLYQVRTHLETIRSLLPR